MAEALLQLAAAPGKEWEIQKALLKVPEVKKVGVVTGEYDLFSLLEAPTERELLELISKQVRVIPGIVKTNTSLLLAE